MNKDNLNNVNWDIIANILTGTATKSQKEEFGNWLGSEKENAILFDEVKKVWLETGRLSDFYSKETEFAWECVKSKTIQKHVKANKIKRLAYYAISLAASLLILFFTGKSVLFPDKMVLTTKENSIFAYNLPDSSIIDLNINSELKYCKKFVKRKREVWLKGEAFFNVKKLNGKPFIINTQYGIFKVLGTSFNISSYKNDSLLSLYVRTGVVEFLPKNVKGSVKIKKGEQIQFNKYNQKLKKEKIQLENYIAWKTGILIFNNLSLGEIAKILEKNFDKEINFGDDSLKQLRFTATFKDKSIDKILKVIKLTLELDIQQENNKIIFTKLKNEKELD